MWRKGNPWYTVWKSESEVAQSCLTLCNPMDCSLARSSVHGILQARILEWVSISFSRGSSQARDWTRVSALQADTLTSEPPGKPLYSTEVPPKMKGSTNMTQQFHFWEESETNILKRYVYSRGYGQIIIAKIWEKLSVHQWMNKENMLFNTYIMEYYSATKEGILPFVRTWMA